MPVPAEVPTEQSNGPRTQEWGLTLQASATRDHFFLEHPIIARSYHDPVLALAAGVVIVCNARVETALKASDSTRQGTGTRLMVT